MITGGGTGGHVFPALAIAEELKARGFEVHYVGSARGFEAKVVPQKGFPFHTVRSGAVKNQSAVTLVSTLFNLFLGFLWALGFLRRQRPVAVIGVGGYVSVPVVFAAALRRIPIYLQEQNASVGIANRVLGRLARRIFLGFAEARSAFPASRCVVTGNPIRRDFFSPELPAYDPRSKRLLVVGGSQGARALNEVVVSLLEDMEREFPGVSILHQTGTADLERIREAYARRFRGQYEVVPFIDDVAMAFARASLVVGRSGALTVSELIQLGRPSLFVPYPRRGQNDQVDNARFVERSGGARVVEQGEGFRERFWEAFSETFRPERLAEMHRSFSPLRKGDALASIADHISQDLTSSPQAEYV